MKRFNKYMEKINKPIDFYETLDMGPYMSDTIDKKAAKKCNYRLFAVVVHHGYDLYSGHYYAYVRGLDDNWYLANDETVRPVHISKILKESAYVLFYQKVDISLPKPKTQLEKSQVQNQLPAVTKKEASKKAKTIIEDLFKKHSKTVPMETEQMDGTPSTESKSPMSIPTLISAPIITQEKMELEKSQKHSKEKPLFIATSKRTQMLRIVSSIHKRAKVEDVVNPVVQIKQKYFNASAPVESWEEKKESDVRVRKMQNASREPMIKMKNEYDLEYDRGKCKKIKQKSQKKFQDGLHKQFMLIQEQKEQLIDTPC